MDFTKTNWNEFKGKIRKQWANLTDSEVDRFKGNVEELAGYIEKNFDESRDQALQKINNFWEQSTNTPAENTTKKENH